MAAEVQRRVYAFQQWVVDPARRELRADGVAVPIGGRAFEILAVLVQAAGELVTKDDLMARVWPGAIVEENTLQVHISALRKALGGDRGLLRTASGRGYRLLGTWTIQPQNPPANRINVPAAPPAAVAGGTDLAHSPSPPRTPPPGASPQSASPQTASARSTLSQATPPQSNLPLPGSDLIGRTAAVQHLRDLMSAYRVVTLTGPGGIGKTRLALQAARDLLADFENNVWLVELAPLADPALVPSAIETVLGLALGEPAVSAEAIARAVGGRKLLLVLDNCEHLIDPAARLVDTLMRMCPNVSVLSTSRELLRIDGECSYRVLPLDVPPEHPRSVDDVLGHSAVQLFVARTKSLNPGFSPNGQDLHAVGAICRRLDGIPLAIEFAAARAATLGLEQVVAGLDDRFGLLTSGRRTALPRHHTLRAMLDWSHDLLIDVERVVLRRLAVFAGGWTLQAACAILETPEISTQDIVDAIASLATKSLVVVETSTNPTRYLLLETIRAYALQKLTEAAELGVTRRSHARYFQDLFERAEAEWRVRPVADWLAAYRREIDNVRTALDWAFSPEGDAVTGVILSASSIRLMFDLSLIAECRRRGELALATIRAGVQVDARREMYLRAALLATGVYLDGPSVETREGWERVLEIATAIGDIDYQTRAVWGLWNDHTYGGMPAESLMFARRYADLSAANGEAWRAVLARRIIGISLHYCGDQIAARPHLEHVLLHYVHGASRPALGSTLNQVTVTRATLARILWLQGKPEQALRLAGQALREAAADDYLLAILYVLVEAAIPLSLFAGDFTATRRFLETLQEQASRSGVRIWQTYGRCFSATVLAVSDDAKSAPTGLIGAIEELRGTGFCEHLTMFLGVLAEAQVSADMMSAAMHTVETALTWCERHGERWFIAELLRIKGEIMARQDADADATFQFQQALNWARQQGAVSWELRTATSFAHLLARQDRPTEAQALLGSVYDRFTEGFETADLRAAGRLLQALQAVSGRHSGATDDR